MREKRKAKRYVLPSHPDWRFETRVLEGDEGGLVVLSRLPLVRQHTYRVDAVEPTAPTDAGSEALVLWSRQTAADPLYQVGMRWTGGSAASGGPLLGSRALRIGPSGGGLAGRIPWQNDFIRNAPPDRAFIARNLSLSGMLMETAEPDPPGDPFAVEIPVGATRFRGLGRVVYTRAIGRVDRGYRHGVEFLDLDDAGLETLGALLTLAR